MANINSKLTPVEYDAAKYKDAVWLSRDSVTVFHALVQSPEVIDKAITTLVSEIAKQYSKKPEDINVNKENSEQFYLWWVSEDGLRKQKSEILIYEVGTEIQLSIAVKNL
jgi:hypothetical protein